MTRPRENAMNKADFSSIHRLRVRWNECDMHGIVFNGNYFIYYDIAMGEWQRAMEQEDVGRPDFITVRAECDFLASAHFDEELDIALRCKRIGTKSIDFETAVFRGPELLNRGKLVYVHVASGSKDPTTLPQQLIDRICAFERISPELISPNRARINA